MANGIGATRGINHLLDALSPAENLRLLGSLSPVFVPVNTVLTEPDRAIDSVFFPINGVISLLAPLEDQTAVEVATVGNEGMVGAPLVRGGSLGFRAVSQMAGWVIQMPAALFLDEMARQDHVRELVNDYLAALLAQVAQSAACGLRHSNEQRLSRWLLMSHDRAGRDVLDISREFLARLLGVPALTAALSVAILEAGGQIRYRHGQISIVDRAGLESSSCECYGAMRRQLDRVAQAAQQRQGSAGPVLAGRARNGLRSVASTSP